MGIIEKIKGLIGLFPGSYRHSNKLLLKAQRAYTQKNFPLAIEKLNELVTQYPESYKGFYSRGLVLYFQTEYLKAADDLMKSIEINPTFTYNYLLCGECYMKLNKHNTAISFFEKGLSYNKLDTYLLNANGFAYLCLHNIETANKNFESAYNVDKSDGLNNTILYYFVNNKFEENLKLIEHSKKLKYNTFGKLILNYLEAMNSCMLENDYSHNINAINKLVPKIKSYGWEFTWIDNWLKHENIDPEKRKFIEELNNDLKEVKEQYS